jgi:uncharacterized protein (DUF885 family)
MTRSQLLALALVHCWLWACHPRGADRPVSTGEAPPQQPAAAAVDFAALANEVLDRQLAAHPERAVELGLHEHDGKLPDVSASGLAKDLERLRQDIAALEAVDVAQLDATQKVERAALLAALHDELFRLEVVRAPWTNPMSYVGALDLTPYISRDYAPIGQRAAAIIALAEAVPAQLQHARANLEPKLARTFIDTALLQVRGTAVFARTDVPAAMKSLPKAERERLVAALETMAKALDEFAVHLEAARSRATDDFALGREAFTRMLAETQGIDVDLDRLRAALEADLERNLAATRAAAANIDPKATVAEVIARVAADRPKPKDVLKTAAAQATDMRKFVVDKGIVSIPSEDVAEVVESPPFMRWNAAFLSGAGPFETAALPSFYYISPPDPKWPVAKQRAYVPDKSDLLFITIHEVWPGHFLHGLHLKKNPSRVLKSLWNYTSGEGWAHYTEEMMWDAGVSEDPRVHLGQLRNALLRNVRALSAIGLHTQGWTVEQSKQMFLEVAFQDEASAEQQAVRGTFDPMYLSYTVGKLVILKLRDDVRAARETAKEEFVLREFHDALLSFGAAPLGAVRSAMLGDGAGAPL